MSDLESLHSKLDDAMRAAEDELIAIHRRIVQVPSVNFGDGSSAREDEVARVMTEILQAAGMNCRTVESASGRANFLASSRGADTAKAERSLLLMGHSDVVPVGDESDWRFPPFSAEIADDRIWGRGSNDCKMLVAAELFAAAMIQRLGLLSRGELRVVIGADEEAGGAMGFGWLERHERDFLKADLAINEGGGAYFGSTAEGDLLFMAGCGEKGRYEVTFTAKGAGTHASVPWKKANPLARLAEVAAFVAHRESRAWPASPIFGSLRKWMDLPGETTEENLEATIEEAGRYSLAFQNSLRAQSRLSIVPTIFNSGGKSNVVPSRAELRCDARIVPGQTRADLDVAIKEILEHFPDVEADISETAAPSVSPYDERIEGYFRRALNRTFTSESSAQILPTWCTGFTDSRFVRLAGTPTYGFQVVEPGADPDRLNIHCVNESIDVSMLLPCALALGHLAIDFLEGDHVR